MKEIVKIIVLMNPVKKLKTESNTGAVVNVGTADHSNDQQQSAYDQYQSQVQQPSEPLQS